MKVATWNVNSLKVRLPQVLNWIESSKVDVFVCKRLNKMNDKFLHMNLQSIGIFLS